MRMPKSIVLGRGTNGTINSVDDAWFEGTDSDNGDCVEETLGLSSVGEDLCALRERITNTRERYVGVLGTQPPNMADHRYLELLVNLCLEHDLRLRLCNFEFLEAHFEEMNRARNALLVDVWYSTGNNSPYPNEEFGVHLLADKLNGGIFRCRAFFVTGFKTIVERLLASKRKDLKWYPICQSTGRLVFKGEEKDVAESLETFAGNFVSYLAFNQLEDLGSTIVVTFNEESVPLKKARPSLLLYALIEDAANGGEGIDSSHLYAAIGAGRRSRRNNPVQEFLSKEERDHCAQVYFTLHKDAIPKQKRILQALRDELAEVRAALGNQLRTLQNTLDSEFDKEITIKDLLSQDTDLSDELLTEDRRVKYLSMAESARSVLQALHTKAESIQTQVENETETFKALKKQRDAAYQCGMKSRFDDKTGKWFTVPKTSPENDYAEELKKRLVAQLNTLEPKPTHFIRFIKAFLKQVGNRWTIKSSHKWRILRNERDGGRKLSAF